MNFKSIYIGCAAVMVSGLLTSCNEDFLDVQPITDISSAQLGQPSVAKIALEGLFEAMNTQYDGIDFNQNCGEAYTNYVFNDCMGSDLVSGIWNNPGQPGLYGWTFITQNNVWATGFPWAYYYGLIAQANRIIEVIPATSEEGEVADASLYLIKASALTMRAHAYQKLLVYYGNRWEDADNGNAYCIVLRTTPSEGASPLVTMNTVLDQIYADCDEAIKLYAKSGQDRANKWETNANVAYGIWSRAALTKHDWATAAEKAEKAMEGYTVMQGDELYAGFYQDSSDFIWSCNPDASLVYYWSWGCHYACNGHYVNYWGMGGGAIDMTLYRLLDEKDLRRAYFWTPDKLDLLTKRQNPGKLTAKAFWDENMVATDNFLNMNISNVYKASKKNYGMIDCIVNWLDLYKNTVFTGDLDAMKQDDGFYNYMFLTPGAKNSTKSVRLANDANGNEVWGTPVNIQFGAQCKFWGNVPYGNSALPWMRASEMALTRAEALAELAKAGHGSTAAAAQAFEEFQKLRVPGYTCTSSGQALIDEIRISRRIELWGEGHNFTDFKRWNLPRIHNEWVAGDVNSGNWVPGSLGTEQMQSQKYSNGWRFAFPTRESQYNPEVQVGLLPQIN